MVNQCSICNMLFNRDKNFIEHMKSHIEIISYKCEKCKKIFFDYSEYTFHHQTHEEASSYNYQETNNEEEIYECKESDEEVSQTETSKIISDHKEPSEKYIKISRDLKIHKKTKNNQKAFECKHCNKTFKAQSSLILHTRIHTGEKPYRCGKCDKAFTQNSSLKSHQKIHNRKNHFKVVLLNFKNPIVGVLLKSATSNDLEKSLT